MTSPNAPTETLVADTSTTQNRRSTPQPRPGLKITIESLNARYRRAVGARGHFPTEQAALECLYLVTRGLDPKGTGQAGWTGPVDAGVRTSTATESSRGTILVASLRSGRQ